MVRLQHCVRYSWWFFTIFLYCICFSTAWAKEGFFQRTANSVKGFFNDEDKNVSNVASETTGDVTKNNPSTQTEYKTRPLQNNGQPYKTKPLGNTYKIKSLDNSSSTNYDAKPLGSPEPFYKTKPLGGMDNTKPLGNNRTKRHKSSKSSPFGTTRMVNDVQQPIIDLKTKPLGSSSGSENIQEPATLKTMPLGRKTTLTTTRPAPTSRLKTKPLGSTPASKTDTKNSISNLKTVPLGSNTKKPKLVPLGSYKTQPLTYKNKKKTSDTEPKLVPIGSGRKTKTDTTMDENRLNADHVPIFYDKIQQQCLEYVKALPKASNEEVLRQYLECNIKALGKRVKGFQKIATNTAKTWDESINLQPYRHNEVLNNCYLLPKPTEKDSFSYDQLYNLCQEYMDKISMLSPSNTVELPETNVAPPQADSRTVESLLPVPDVVLKTLQQTIDNANASIEKECWLYKTIPAKYQDCLEQLPMYVTCIRDIYTRIQTQNDEYNQRCVKRKGTKYPDTLISGESKIEGPYIDKNTIISLREQYLKICLFAKEQTLTKQAESASKECSIIYKRYQLFSQ